jgi:photosystem II stability/assembly factor-like uncharacterized protein
MAGDQPLSDLQTAAVHPARSDVIYLGTGSSGILRSTDGGVTWVGTGLDSGNVSALAFDPQNDAIVYAARWLGGVLRSTDEGATWSAVPNGGIDAGDFRRLAVDPENSARIYAIVWGAIYMIDLESH